MHARRTPLISLALFILVLSWSCGFGCGGKKSQFPAHFKVFYTADTRGSLFPCGCHVPLGGLSRRGGVIEQDRAAYPEQLVVDAGSFCGGSSYYDRFVASWLLKGYAAIGYHAVNLGTIESSIPVSQLREWDNVSGGVLVSANLVDESNMPVTRRSLVREIGGIRVGITGITMAREQPSGASGLPKVVLPVPPLLDVMKEFRQQHVDFTVLLADTVRPEVEAITRSVAGIDLIVQGRGFSLMDVYGVERVGDSRVVTIGDMGKHLGWVRLDFDPDGTVTGEEAGVVKLDNSVPTLPAISELLVQFRTELRNNREQFLGDPGNPFQRAGSADLVDVLVGYTGSNHCLECHVGYSMDQTVVGHEGAWLGLSSNDKTNPACLPCHTTGYGVPTGLQDPYRDSHLAGVFCEACHGPAALHVREEMIRVKGLDESAMLPPENPTGLEFSREVPEAVCLRCHTPEWSPDFNYREWLPKVNHASVPRQPRIIDQETGRTVAPVPPSEDDNRSAGQ